MRLRLYDEDVSMLEVCVGLLRTSCSLPRAADERERR
jgi:hypothetical protein